MDVSNFCKEYFSAMQDCIRSVDPSDLEKVLELVIACSSNGGKILLFGNGGSAAMASHVSVDFTKAAGVRSVNFNEADLITCFANDYGYENWVAEAIKAFGDPKDLTILISSSGNSLNMINGAEAAKRIGTSVVTLTGFSPKNPLRTFGQVNLWANSTAYNVVEMTHHIWLLAIVDMVIERNSVK